MGDFVLSALEERVLRTLRDSQRMYLSIYQLAVELDDYDAGDLLSASRSLVRRMLATGDSEHGYACTGIGEAHLAQLALARARR
jgi:hypothetical protein